MYNTWSTHIRTCWRHTSTNQQSRTCTCKFIAHIIIKDKKWVRDSEPKERQSTTCHFSATSWCYFKCWRNNTAQEKGNMGKRTINWALNPWPTLYRGVSAIIMSCRIGTPLRPTSPLTYVLTLIAHTFNVKVYSDKLQTLVGQHKKHHLCITFTKGCPTHIHTHM